MYLLSRGLSSNVGVRSKVGLFSISKVLDSSVFSIGVGLVTLKIINIGATMLSYNEALGLTEIKNNMGIA